MSITCGADDDGASLLKNIIIMQYFYDYDLKPAKRKQKNNNKTDINPAGKMDPLIKY